MSEEEEEEKKTAAGHFNPHVESESSDEDTADNILSHLNVWEVLSLLGFHVVWL